MARSLALMIGMPVLAMLLSGCSDSCEESVAEQTEAHEQLSDVLSGIVDTATLDAALPELRALSRKYLEAEALAKAAGEPDEERRRELLAEYKARTGAASDRQGNEMKRLAKALSTTDMARLVDAIKDFPAD